MAGDGWGQLGESIDFGESVLTLLERDGWSIARRIGFAGASILLIATRRDLDRSICAEGPTSNAAALSLFNAIAYEPSLMRPAA